VPRDSGVCVMYENIVVGTDCSVTADRAVAKAAEVAKMTRAKLHLVCAYRAPVPAMVAAEAPTVFAGDLTAEAIHDLTSRVEAMADRLRADGIDVDARVQTGAAAATLMTVAGAVNADLLVVGDRGLKGVRGLLGSVPNRVTHRACLDVLVVHTT
jgi:nucleotide-binding universal stress UspA family protein